MYKILSIDGGGIRGILAAAILERINRETDFLRHVDLAAGTSTGGLIALSISAGIDIKEIKNIYINKSEFIFKDNFFDDVKDLFGLAGADYNLTNLQCVLREVFGDMRLRDLKKHVMVTAFNLDNNNADPLKRSWQPRYFTNFDFKNVLDETSAERSADMFCYKAGIYTAAAPTYFPSVDGYIDGGIFASNPSVEALCIAPYGDPVLFSVGTGITNKYIVQNNNDWGNAQWLNNLIDAMMDGQRESAHHQCMELMGKNYFRIAPVFPGNVNVAMDDVSKVEYMLQFAEQVDIEPAVKFIKEVWLNNREESVNV